MKILCIVCRKPAEFGIVFPNGRNDTEELEPEDTDFFCCEHFKKAASEMKSLAFYLKPKPEVEQEQ